MTKIDAHVHYVGDHPESVAALERLDLKLFNVCVVHGAEEDWRELGSRYRGLTEEHPERFFWCTSFDLPDFEPDYAECIIAGLERDFALGALACKFWKNIGMEIRKPSGEFLLIDDPLFDPIYEYLTKVSRPALMHIAEPLACWQPLDEKNGHFGYYSKHPEWHMYGRSEFPSHRDLIDARDRVLARHPKLRLIGAHLGSLEYDVREVAKRLEMYPNLAVDSSARTHDLALQDSGTVREFFIKYRDRVLFGTDIVQRESRSSLSAEERQGQLSALEGRYLDTFRYYESGSAMTIRGIATKGLALSSAVLDRFYHLNAAIWYPGL